MATTSELLTALTNARNTIRTKLVALGLVTAAAKLADCATAIDGIDEATFDAELRIQREQQR